MREELATVQRDLEASRAIRSELATELANATTNRKLAEERLETERLRAEELIKQIEEKETAIATLKTELKKLEDNLAEATRNETFLSEELQRFKYGVVPSEESHGEQLQLFPPEEQAAITPKTETENTESPAVKTEPVNPEPSRGTTKPKLLTAGELVKWISDNHPNKKPVEYHNLRDWFKKGSTCSDKKRAEVQEEYGFKFSHQDRKGTLWFTVG